MCYKKSTKRTFIAKITVISCEFIFLRCGFDEV